MSKIVTVLHFIRNDKTISQIMLIDAKPKYVVDKIIPFCDHVKEELLPNVSSIAVYKTKTDKQLNVVGLSEVFKVISVNELELVR